MTATRRAVWSVAALTVLDERGDRVVLGTLWAERPAVLVFTRHFG